MTEDDVQETVDEILETYPGAKPFQDLISASTLQDYASVAKDLDSRVKKLAATKPSSTPRTPQPKTEQTVNVKEAVDARDWSGFLAAKWAEQQGNTNA